MNSLEFIEKEIKQCKDFVKTLKRDENPNLSLNKMIPKIKEE